MISRKNKNAKGAKMGNLKNNSKIYNFVDGKKLKAIGLGGLAVLPILTAVAGVAMWAITNDNLAEYDRHAEDYNYTSGILDFVEENKDKEQLYSQDSEDNVVLSKNDWTRIKNLYEHYIVESQEECDAGIISRQELNQREQEFISQFREALSEQDFVSIVAGEGIVKSNQTNLALRPAGIAMTVVAGTVFTLAELAYFAISSDEKL